MTERAETAGLLINHCADMLVADINGRTPLDKALLENHTAAAKLLTNRNFNQ